MDKTTEIYRTPAPPEQKPDAAPQTPALSGYTLFPDAGDFAGLDTTAVPPELPSAPTYPSPAPTPLPPPAVLPETTSAPTSPLPEHTLSKPAVPLSRHLLRLLYVLCALLAVFVYTDLLLSGGASLFAEGLGKLAVSSVFGSAETVTVIPSVPDISAAPDTTDTTETSPAPETMPETAPPATEQPVPAPAAGILDRDLSSSFPDGLGLINETPYTPDLQSLAAQSPVIDTYAALESVYGRDCPAVLILHTHGTEAFQDQSEAGYHTSDRTKNICTVGEALAQTLQSAGIGVIHCTDLFDDESFDMAYYNAARYIRQTLEDNPSIRYILDIHRDAITTEDGSGIRPLSTHDNTDYAQMMFVVGTDHGGSGHTGWETNLALAARLQSALHMENPTLMRDINLRSASFNAQYAPGSLLIEAGAACSTLEEAVRSIQVLGKALAEEILGE